MKVVTVPLWLHPDGMRGRLLQTLLALPILGGLAFLGPEGPASADPPAGDPAVPVVVELFTSEGCSSCPPADEILRELDRTQPIRGVQIIPLEMHVDYWNDLGWADPFSDPSYSARQRGYASALGSQRVYTPQAVVDGEIEMVGSSGSRLREAIAGRRRPPSASVELSRKPDGGLDVRVTLAGNGAGRPEVFLALTEGGLKTAVQRGENSGRTLPHAPVVRSFTRLGAVSGGHFTGSAPLPQKKGAPRDLRAVVVVQDAGSRHMLGAATLRL